MKWGDDMADIELVIKIPEEVKHKVYAYGLSLCPSDKEQLIHAIMNGTPLPKGHGRLGDLDILFNKAIKHRKTYMEAELGDSGYCRGKLHAYELYVEEVENADTIIEADKEIQ